MSESKKQYFFDLTFEEGRVRQIKHQISKHLQLDGDICHVWTGAKDKDGYGVKSVSVNGIEYKIRVHRAVYFLNTECRPIPIELHISHLCGNKLCCHVPHLNLESCGTNNHRQACMREGICFGHDGCPDCIFRYLILFNHACRLFLFFGAVTFHFLFCF